MDKKSSANIKSLDQKLTALLHDLKNYTDAKLNEQPNSISWSVLQIMQHLMKAEAASLEYVKKKLSFDPVLEKAGVMSGVRSSLINMTLSMPFKIKAPEVTSGAHLLTDLTFWDVAKQWKQQREEMKEFLESLSEEHFETDLYKHPMIGKVTLGGMLSFFNKHVDRHTKQIRKTLKKIDAVKQI